jgi:cytochrome P450 family 110
MLFVSAYLANRNSVVIPEPELFKPERFLENRYGATEYIPNGGGTRSCIGAAIAHYEIKIIMATLVQRVEFVADPSVKVIVGKRANIFLAPSHGIPIVIKGYNPPKTPPHPQCVHQ